MKMLFILQQPRRKPSSQIKKKTISIDNLIASLLEVVVAIGTNPTHIPWDGTVLGRNTNSLLYIHMSDILEVAFGN